MNVGVVGLGIVGQAHRQHFIERGLSVWGCDTDGMKQGASHSLAEIAFGCELIFICVPTPPLLDQKGDIIGIDHTIVISVVRELGQIIRGNRLPHKIILRSTVGLEFFREYGPGNDYIDLVYMPEFLSEKTAEKDFRGPHRPYVVGMPQPNVFSTWSESMRVLTKKLWSILPVSPEAANITTYGEAVMIKLATNSFYALKVTFANTLKAMADEIGNQNGQLFPMSYEKIAAVLSRDPRVGSVQSDRAGRDVHLRVAQDGKPGFGGKCLPKDLAELRAMLLKMSIATTHGYILTAVEVQNRETRRR